MLFLQAAPTSAPWLDTFTNVGAMGLLAGMLFYGLPKVLHAFRESRNEDREVMKEAFTAIREDRHADRNALNTIVLQFQLDTKYEREQCDKHHEALTATIQAGQVALSSAINQLDKSHEALCQAICQLGNAAKRE